MGSVTRFGDDLFPYVNTEEGLKNNIPAKGYQYSSPSRTIVFRQAAPFSLAVELPFPQCKRMLPAE